MERTPPDDRPLAYNRLSSEDTVAPVDDMPPAYTRLSSEDRPPAYTRLSPQNTVAPADSRPPPYRPLSFEEYMQAIRNALSTEDIPRLRQIHLARVLERQRTYQQPPAPPEYIIQLSPQHGFTTPQDFAAAMGITSKLPTLHTLELDTHDPMSERPTMDVAVLPEDLLSTDMIPGPVKYFYALVAALKKRELHLSDREGNRVLWPYASRRVRGVTSYSIHSEDEEAVVEAEV
jgi:hypothetical protein